MSGRPKASPLNRPQPRGSTRAHAPRTVRAPKVGFVSLGCPKALVDSERILTQLRAEGYEVAPTYEAADLVVLNTCHIREKAAEKAYSDVGRLKREDGSKPLIALAGCVAGTVLALVVRAALNASGIMLPPPPGATHGVHELPHAATLVSLTQAPPHR